MKYTIDALKVILTTHRLNMDGEFVPIKDPNRILENDKVFSSHEEAKFWLSQFDSVKVGDEEIKLRKLGISLTETHIDIKQHRSKKPNNKVFTKEQVKSALQNGNDNIHNILVVTWEGEVKLIPNDYKGEEPAVRFESFVAGNGYVGSTSSLYHLDDTYLSLLEGWATHLGSSEPVYRDYPSSRTEAEILKEIEELYENCVFI